MLSIHRMSNRILEIIYQTLHAEGITALTLVLEGEASISSANNCGPMAAKLN